MAQISLKGMTKVYGHDVVAVDNIDLEIRDGEFMVLLGPSGCGKSTTLRMIAGLEEITGGELVIDGRLMNDVDPADRDLAIVFQNYALYPHMTVSGNMAFGLRLRKVERNEVERRISKTAAMLGMEGLLARRPRELSGGQQQRVALGRALVRDPVAFLFDEPLSNLDAKLRAAMRTELIKIHRELGKTIVHVTHDQVEAMTMGERICIMRDGRIVQVGAPLEVYRHPVDTFVAGFLASPPMNLLDARLASAGGKQVVELSTMKFPVSTGLSAALDRHDGSAIIFGIRPEDLYTDPTGTDHLPLDVKIVAVEALGPEVVVVASLSSGQEISARLGRGFSSTAGSDLRLYADLEMMHLFDPRSGQAIATG
ncbi:MAG: ABC transporter ATP-binding protein [Gammaproteobacteria bacterium]